MRSDIKWKHLWNYLKVEFHDKHVCVSEQAQHKTGCTATEDRIEAGNFWYNK